MCGIAGLDLQTDEDSVERTLCRMNAAMFHRGPDDGGVAVINADGRCVGLGARRLAIQDLSLAGHQPMQDSDTGNQIVFNGEVYNFCELRADLAAAGVTFRSSSDTEVVLKAYARWGLETTLRRIHGMFAFALWDEPGHRLILARDRLGVKPLYYAETAGGIVFASEVRALLASGLVQPRLSLEGMISYLALGAVQEPYTLVEGVRALPPGSFGVRHGAGFSVTPYWSLLNCFLHQQSSFTRARAIRELRGCLEDAVRLRLISDAPVGIFLSGGLDSTAVVALAARAGSTELRTVSVVFREEDFSEESYIREVVNRFDTEHTQIQLTGTDLLQMLPRALEAMDQPTFDGVNTFVVAGQARAAGLVVALSGIGGDELFGGYASFRRVPGLQAIARWLPATVGRVAARIAPLIKDDDQVRKLARWLAQRDLDDGAHALVRELFGPADRGRLTRGRCPRLHGTLPDGHGLDAFNVVSHFEFAHYLRNVLLRDTDVMGMAHSLEVREPLLDHHLLELVASMPGALKEAGTGPKPLLVDALDADIPKRLTHRKKLGFTLPFARWLHGPLRKPVQEALLDPQFGGQLSEALDADAVAAVWHRFVDGRGTWVRPWALYVLKCWGEQHLPTGQYGAEAPEPHAARSDVFWSVSGGACR